MALVASVLLIGCAPVNGMTDPDENPPPPAVQVAWFDPTVVADLGDGWTASACDGGAPLLCIEREGVAVGTVEALAYPVDSFDDLDLTGDPADNLRILASGYVLALTTDRAVGCGADYQLRPVDPRDFPLGDGGLAYGFEGRMPDGRPSELNLQYSTIVDGMIISIVAAAYDEGGCPGRDDSSGFDSAGLAEFRDRLEKLLIDSPLPDLERLGFGL